MDPHKWQMRAVSTKQILEAIWFEIAVLGTIVCSCIKTRFEIDFESQEEQEQARKE